MPPGLPRLVLVLVPSLWLVPSLGLVPSLWLVLLVPSLVPSLGLLVPEL